MANTKYTKNSRGYFETKIWDGTYTASGAKHRKTIISKKSSADLEKKVAAFRRQLEEREVALVNITLGEYAEQWLSLYKSTKEKNTQSMYRTSVKYLDSISHVRLSDLKHSHFQQVINENMEHPKTCKNIKLAFTQIIKSAIRDHYLPHSALADITEDISLPKYQKPQKRALSILEKRCMFEAELSDMKRAFVTVLYYCGTRRGEALALTSGDFDWDEKTVSISKVVIFDGNAPEIKPYPKSDNGIRRIPLPDACISILKPYVDNCEGYLFKGQNTALLTETGYKRMWESILTAMNVAAGYNPQAKKDRGDRPIQGLTAHIFRHNYCTRLCYQIPAISTKKIAQLMGDTEKVVLNVYSHILEEQEDVFTAVNNAF
jgi:integrase